MGYLVSIGISAGIIAAIFIQYAAVMNVVSWISFVSMASFYAAGGKNEGFIKGGAANLSGVFWAMFIFQGAQFIASEYSLAIMVFIAVVAMCAQAKINILSFIPGTFCGAACVFGTNGNWQVVVTALILGSVMGWLSEQGGLIIFKAISKQSMENDAST